MTESEVKDVSKMYIDFLDECLKDPSIGNEEYLKLADDVSASWQQIQSQLSHDGDQYPSYLIFHVYGTFDVLIDILLARGFLNKENKALILKMKYNWAMPTQVAKSIADEQFNRYGEIDMNFMGKRLIWKENTSVYYTGQKPLSE